MVIECRGCFKNFKLDEKLLKSQGSRVRCSKYGEIFLAFPSENGEPRRSTTGSDREDLISDQGECGAGVRKRRYPRIPVSIPATCNNLDAAGRPTDLQIGVIKEVSPTGVAIELFSGAVTDVVSLSFIGDDNKDVQICGRVAHSKMTPAGKVRIGLSLLGAPIEVHHFVMQAVRTQHQSGMDRR